MEVRRKEGSLYRVIIIYFLGKEGKYFNSGRIYFCRGFVVLLMGVFLVFLGKAFV